MSSKQKGSLRVEKKKPTKAQLAHQKKFAIASEKASIKLKEKGNKSNFQQLVKKEMKKL